jgi:hypothetical protein
MDLPSGASFYGYDIHQQRVDFLNRYFGLLPTIQARALVQDILVHYPEESGDVALLLKEIHRMEKRRRGIVLPLLDALAVRWIVLSSPTHSRCTRSWRAGPGRSPRSSSRTNWYTASINPHDRRRYSGPVRTVRVVSRSR